MLSFPAPRLARVFSEHDRLVLSGEYAFLLSSMGCWAAPLAGGEWVSLMLPINPTMASLDTFVEARVRGFTHLFHAAGQGGAVFTGGQVAGGGSVAPGYLPHPTDPDKSLQVVGVGVARRSASPSFRRVSLDTFAGEERTGSDVGAVFPYSNQVHVAAIGYTGNQCSVVFRYGEQNSRVRQLMLVRYPVGQRAEREGSVGRKNWTRETVSQAAVYDRTLVYRMHGRLARYDFQTHKDEKSAVRVSTPVRLSPDGSRVAAGHGTTLVVATLTLSVTTVLEVGEKVLDVGFSDDGLRVTALTPTNLFVYDVD